MYVYVPLNPDRVLLTIVSYYGLSNNLCCYLWRYRLSFWSFDVQDLFQIDARKILEGI